MQSFWILASGTLLVALAGCHRPSQSTAPASQVRDRSSEVAEMLELKSPTFRYEPAAGLGLEPGVCRRDPSDIISVAETYYVWYTKVHEEDVPLPVEGGMATPMFIR
ncbi:MAG TPA: hypothetical protein VM487_14250 [Phycisphaerae bacterium]|nr:hypothetical protein [Phycisphaerae bacterium]